jgi:hypothetical protein
VPFRLFLARMIVALGTRRSKYDLCNEKKLGSLTVADEYVEVQMGCLRGVCQIR